jgi:hypothetical protein
VAGPSYTLEAWILGKRPPTESFQTLTVFSVAQGTTLALQRLFQKKATAISLDLFDEAALLVEEPNSGQAVFVKEVRLLTRYPTLGKSYQTLQMASQFATLVARNPSGSESRPVIYALLGEAFGAFATSGRPDIVYLKSVYRFCRDEGYPLKQAWVPTLRATERAAAIEILNQPMSAQTADAKVVARLQRGLDDYLRGETEIQLD